MKKKIIWLFYLLFAICFTFTAINIILHNTYYKALHLICVTTICLVGLTIIYKNLSKNEKFIEKNYNKILISFGIGMFIIEIVLGRVRMNFQFQPVCSKSFASQLCGENSFFRVTYTGGVGQ